MTALMSYRIVRENRFRENTIQLIEDQWGGYRLRWVSNDGKQTLVSAPVHSDPRVLAEAREHFPDVLPFGGLPVDAT
ncbi:MAG: hypothetical protein QG577_1358 [Thermodesulfobacteriota bacterium]|nr:hypothetical protein [Thermodesulfobacteriota bacterium]